MGFRGRLSSNETRVNSRLCSFCSQKGRYCDIAEAPFEKRNRLIAIRDQVKEVENSFVFLQEESRQNLVAKVAEYKGRRKLNVLTELNACFGSENNVPLIGILERVAKVVGIAVKLVMVSASISFVIAACKTRQLLYTSSTKMIPFLVSKEAGKIDGLLTFSKIPLDVFFW
ncbi:hypothetical protein D8674_000737 [Pyrus ussuriensis x Pyrus communis]|uniref:Uncharacterized protein n=1 Tax=Pyrus ussuriensis x Pyrus communis TaxID=2448454 RepID=A0A5N5F4C5_9ROSA|nr:hypothetical protein D8674_000737 [Pyrus ussuriensis x Pyrus communis]